MIVTNLNIMNRRRQQCFTPAAACFKGCEVDPMHQCLPLLLTVIILKAGSAGDDLDSGRMPVICNVLWYSGHQRRKME